jgi:hypothetical protein
VQDSRGNTALHIAAKDWKLKERQGQPEFNGNNNFPIILVKCGANLELKGFVCYYKFFVICVKIIKERQLLIT